MSFKTIPPLAGTAASTDTEFSGIGGRIEDAGKPGRTVLRIARIVWGANASLGIVRNISSNDLTLEVPGNLPPGGLVDIDMGARTLKGRLHWREGLSAGIRLLEPVDIDQVLEKQAIDENGRVIRSPRVAVVFPAEIQVGSIWRHVEIRDISVGGARIACKEPIANGERVLLRIPRHDPVSAAVRWATNGEAGIAFDKPLRISWLMDWLSSTASGASRSSVSPSGSKVHLEAIVIGAIVAASYLNSAIHLFH